MQIQIPNCTTCQIIESQRNLIIHQKKLLHEQRETIIRLTALQNYFLNPHRLN